MRLAYNKSMSFQGSIVLGSGFVLSDEVGKHWLEADPSLSDVIYPYLNGEDLNSRPDASASRWVINFFDWSEERAREYQVPYSHIEQHVKPERQRRKPNGDYQLRKPLPIRWWQYAEKRPTLHAALERVGRCIVIAIVSKAIIPYRVDALQVFSHRVAVFPADDSALLAVLSSNFHWLWAVRYSSTLETRVNYSITDALETFPFAPASGAIEDVGEELDSTRREIMLRLNLGLTKLYNRVHDPDDAGQDIVVLRDIHRRIDVAVAAAYGWSDLSLEHGHHPTPQGIRWTVAPAAQREILDRLLELNHQRHAEEVAAGVVDGRKAGRKRAAASVEGQLSMEDA